MTPFASSILSLFTFGLDREIGLTRPSLFVSQSFSTYFVLLFIWVRCIFSIPPGKQTKHKREIVCVYLVFYSRSYRNWKTSFVRLVRLVVHHGSIVLLVHLFRTFQVHHNFGLTDLISRWPTSKTLLISNRTTTILYLRLEQNRQKIFNLLCFPHTRKESRYYEESRWVMVQ